MPLILTFMTYRAPFHPHVKSAALPDFNKTLTILNSKKPMKPKKIRESEVDYLGSPEEPGAGSRIRTDDLLITNCLLNCSILFRTFLNCIRQACLIA